MKKITKRELDTFLRKHKLWLEGDKKGERANLREANLREADLRGANLREANLREADLREADLRGANLRWANLRGADLCEANLREADLYGADLRGANLCEANLREANLCEANLREANLREADLREAKHLPPIACPEEGSFIGFKKSGRDDQGHKYIIKLQIPDDAKRCSATSSKCRCSKAIVLSITNLDGTDSGIDEIHSGHDRSFIYKVGSTVEVSDFCEDRWEECSAGIHFFITRQEAVDYC